MTTKFRYIVPLLASAGAAGLLLAAPTASAKPDCVDVGQRTTQCTTNGSTSITTSPPPMSFSPWYAFPYGGFNIILGR